MLTRNFETLQQLVACDVANRRIAQNVYWSPTFQRGCFIGCLSRSDDPAIAEKQWGIPVMLQRIAENIFEYLPLDEARQFFADLPAAIGCDGKDLTLVSWQFLAAELRALPPQPAEIQAGIDPVIAGMDLLAAGQWWPTAMSAAKAADAAVGAAVGTAAEPAATAAWCATGAAGRAADAAAEAAGNTGEMLAAYLSARRRQRDTLLRLIANAPTRQQ